MIIVTGNTFDHRDTLKALGGRWNNAARNWQFDQLSETNIKRLKALVGVFITVDLEPSPYDDDDDTLSEILERIERPTITPREGRTNMFGDDPTWFNYFKDQNPTAFFGFSSLSEILDFVDRTPAGVSDDERGNRNEGWQTDQPKWYGTDSIKHAMRLARDGWSEGMEKAERIIELIDGINAQQKKRHYTLAGGTVSVGRMLSGNPAHMSKRKKQPGHKIVTLFIDGAMSSGVDAENAIIRAAIIAALADILETNDYRCEIVITCNTTEPGFVGGNAAYQVTTIIKRANEALSMIDLIFALGHPSYFRRIVFATVANDPDCRPYWSSMGMPSTAFNSSHPLKTNEFHVRLLTIDNQDRMTGTTLEQRALSMLPLIVPKGFPIEIKKEQ